MADVSYERDRRWSDSYIPELCRVLGPLLIKPAPLVLDLTEATDLMVLTTRDIRIAARMRSPGVALSYRNDFTVRLRRHDSGVQTEMSKILDGFGDWMIYAHAAPGIEPKLESWMVIDLHAFRHHLSLEENRNPHTCTFTYDYRDNKDFRTSFVAFDVTTFRGDPQILIARSPDPGNSFIPIQEKLALA